MFKPTKALVDKDVVYEEVGKAIEGNAQSYPEQSIEAIEQSYEEANDARNGENEEEEIIAFEEPSRLLTVMVLM